MHAQDEPNLNLFYLHMFKDKQALMAQLDACPTGDQEVAGLIPAGSATFFHGD